MKVSVFPRCKTPRAAVTFLPQDTGGGIINTGVYLTADCVQTKEKREKKEDLMIETILREFVIKKCKLNFCDILF